MFGIAQVHKGLVADDHAGKVDQDRSQGCQACSLCDVSAGGGSGIEILVL